MTGGDFVRNVKQTIDLLRQIADVAPDPDTAADRARRRRRAASAAWSRRRASSAAPDARMIRARRGVGEPGDGSARSRGRAATTPRSAAAVAASARRARPVRARRRRRDLARAVGLVPR